MAPRHSAEFAEALAQRARDHLVASADTKRAVAEQTVPAIVAAAQAIVDTLSAGGKILLCGNGGSAADCQHMATELVARFSKEVDRPGLPAIALTTDTSLLTAYANDFGFDGVFARQVLALGRPGDILIAISTSGSSPSILRAVEAASSRDMKVVALTGSGGALATMARYPIAVPHANTQHIQESHLAIEHVLCDLIEQSLFGAGRAR